MTTLPTLSEHAPYSTEPRAALASEAPPRLERRRWRKLAPLGPLALYTVLALAQFRHAWASPTTRWIGVDGDPAQQMWLLAWTPSAIADGSSPLFTTYMNYPSGVNLMWNTLMPLAGLVLAPVTWLFGPVLSWNVLLTSGPVLSAWTACLLARRYCGNERLGASCVQHPGSWPAATVAGLVFGFSPYVMAHSFGHANLTFLALVPVAFLLLDDLLIRQQRRAWITGGLLGIVLVSQLLVTEELLASMALGAGFGVAALVVLRPAEVRPRVRYAARGFAVAAGVMLALAAYPLYVQFFGARPIRSGSIQEPGVYVTDLVELIRPSGLQQFAPSWATEGALNFAPVGLEWNGYIGIPLLALAGWIVWRYRAMLAVKVFAVVAVGMTVLALGPELRVDGRYTDIPLPFRLVELFPVVGHMLSNRLMAYVFLCLGLLVAIFLGAQHATGDRRRVAVAYGAAIFALLPLVPAQPWPWTEAEIPAFFEPGGAVERIPRDSVAVVVPYTEGPATARSQLWMANAGMRYKIPAGYFMAPDRNGAARYGSADADDSVTYVTLSALQRGEALEPDAEVVSGVQDDLDRWGVETVVVGPTAVGQDEAIELFTEVLGEAPEHVDGVDVWWEVGS